MILAAMALIAATPTTLPAVIASARPGDTVRLAPGGYAALAIRDRTWLPRLTLDARGATIATMRLERVVGLDVVGGTFVAGASAPAVFWERAVSVETGAQLSFSRVRVEGADLRGFGLIAHKVDRLRIENSDFTNLHTAIQIDESTNAVVHASRFFKLRSDAVDIAASQHVLVERIECSDSRPLTREPGADHPDCVQLWSRKGLPPTADVTIRGNRAHGMTQGFSGFDHGEGGFDRIRVEDNHAELSYPQAYGWNECRDCEIIRNVARTIAGSPYQARINVEGGSVRVEDNDIGPK